MQEKRKYTIQFLKKLMVRWVLLKNFLFSSLEKKIESPKNEKNQKIFQKELLDNPYLQSKALWGEVYGDLNQRHQRSQKIQIGLLVLIGLLILGFIVLASQTRIRAVPFVVQGDELLTLTHAVKSDDPELRAQLMPYFVKQFIRATRSMSVDQEVNRTHRLMSYSWVANAAISVLNDFYAQQDHKKSNDDLTVNTIAITSVLALSSHTVAVRWREVWRNAQTGELIKTEHYLAQLTIRYESPSDNPIVLTYNPLGFYITSFSWSRDQNT